jgi:hypothetical protein
MRSDDVAGLVPHGTLGGVWECLVKSADQSLSLVIVGAEKRVRARLPNKHQALVFLWASRSRREFGLDLPAFVLNRGFFFRLRVIFGCGSSGSGRDLPRSVATRYPAFCPFA